MLPIQISTDDSGMIHLVAPAGSVLKFKFPAVLGTPDEIYNKIGVAYDATDGTISLTAKENLELDLPAPQGWKFGEDPTNEFIEAAISIGIYGWHIPGLIYWNPSTGTFGAKAFHGLGPV